MVTPPPTPPPLQASLKPPSLPFQDGSKNVNFQPLVEALSDIPRPSESGWPEWEVGVAGAGMGVETLS